MDPIDAARNSGNNAEPTPFFFVANSLWLDFVNTRVMVDGSPDDLIREYPALMEWMRISGVLTGDEQRSLASRWTPLGNFLLAEAHEFRETLRDLAIGLIAGRTANEREIDAINVRLAAGSAYNQLAVGTSGYLQAKTFAWNQPSDLLTPIAQSAADLLTNGDPALIRKCESPSCILFFYDNTKNHARRWCSMAGCGNRHKQASHRARRGRSDTG